MHLEKKKIHQWVMKNKFIVKKNFYLYTKIKVM